MSLRSIFIKSYFNFKKRVISITRTKTYLQLRLSKEDKEFIKTKAKDLDYPSVSAFLLRCAKEYFTVEIDLSKYQEIAKEINYIGKNINSLVRRINTDGFYTNVDIEALMANQEKIIELMNKEYGRLLKEQKKYMQGNLSNKDKEKLIKLFLKEELQVPKSVLLEEVFDRIRADVAYICGLIEMSSIKHYKFDGYIWRYVYRGRTLYELEPNRLIQFSDDLFMYTQKLKMKMVRLKNEFTEDDFDELKEILDEYEIY